MTAPHLVAVIDIGKTNAKLALFDLKARQEIDRLTMPNRVVGGGPYPHYDVEAIWDFLLSGLGRLGAAHRLDAISVTTHGASAALLDGSGGLALPVLDYEHDGPESLAADYDRLRPAFAETGSPRLPNGLNLGAQLYWQSRQFPQDFARVARIVTYPQYWAFRLSGVLANEATSLGCHTDLWSHAAGDYSTLVDRMGWRALMPPLRRAGDCLGPLRSDLADRTGLPQGIPVYCGIHDSNASLYPHLLAQTPPFAVVSTGTWVVCLAIGGQRVELDPARDTLVNVDALGRPVPSARFMGGREYELLDVSLPAAPTTGDESAVLRAGAMLLPSVVAGCGPFPGQAMRWVDAGALTNGQRHIAISWYLGLMSATCLGLIGADGPIIVEGPLAANRAYLDMLSAATGRELRLSRGKTTGTTLGAALLCAGGSAPADLASHRPDRPDLAAYAQSWNSRVAARAGEDAAGKRA